ncbi:MAG: hypothetical protein BMS9Abin13_368 [Patescibacteria group bacterium]|nr:MAG: hypothetical protein BMS9Abin13_368 [Patescibacteria group bacterium]
MNFENFEDAEKNKFENLQEYIENGSQVLVPVEQIKDMYRDALKPKTATLGYANADSVKFNVKGYNLIYVNGNTGLSHVEIIPEAISSLKKSGRLHEREELEKELEELGFIVNNSEEFFNAIDKHVKQ